MAASSKNTDISVDPNLIPTNTEEIPLFMWELHVRGMSLRQIAQILGISHETVRRKLQEFKRTAFENISNASMHEIAGDSVLFLQKLRQQFVVDANSSGSSPLMKYNNFRAALEVNDRLMKLYYDQGLLDKSADTKSDLEKRLDRMSKSELEARKQELITEIMEVSEIPLND